MRHQSRHFTTMAAISLRTFRPLGRTVCCLVMLAATPGMAEPPTIESAAQVPAVASNKDAALLATVSPTTPEALEAREARLLEARLLQDTADKLSARTHQMVDLIVRGQTVRLMEGLTRSSDEKSTVGEEISKRIDVRLAATLSELRDTSSAPAKTSARRDL